MSLFRRSLAFLLLLGLLLMTGAAWAQVNRTAPSPGSPRTKVAGLLRWCGDHHHQHRDWSCAIN